MPELLSSVAVVDVWLGDGREIFGRKVGNIRYVLTFNQETGLQFSQNNVGACCSDIIILFFLCQPLSYHASRDRRYQLTYIKRYNA